MESIDFGVQNFQTFLNELELKLQRDNSKRVVFTGNLNIDLLNLDNGQKYLEIMEGLGFVCKMQNPTRISQTRQSSLDHLFLRQLGTALQILNFQCKT